MIVLTAHSVNDGEEHKDIIAPSAIPHEYKHKHGSACLDDLHSGALSWRCGVHIFES